VKVKKLSPIPSQNIISSNTRKKILVLDLDETLVHSSIHNPFPNKRNIIFNMNINNIKYKIYVIIRPFFEKFLYEMSHCYDLYIFTASISNYAKPLIEIIDKNKVIIQVLTRDNCLKVKGVPLKDLSIFNKDLKDIIIIDNNPVSYALHKNNGIPILTWIDNPNDNELLKLIPILKYMSKVKDVRPIINYLIIILELQIVNFFVNFNNLAKY
jgi:Dullard-like phosphatase family protein